MIISIFNIPLFVLLLTLFGQALAILIGSTDIGVDNSSISYKLFILLKDGSGKANVEVITYEELS